MLRVEFQRLVNGRVESDHRTFINGRMTMPIYRGIVCQLRRENCTTWAQVWKDGEKLFTITWDLLDFAPYFKQGDLDIHRPGIGYATVRSMVVE